jgi:hypothetical protein
MRRTLSRLVALAAFLAPAAALAQPPQPGLPQPTLTTVTPAGGKAGSSVEIVLAGTDLDLPAQLVTSHPGITAEAVLPPVPPADPKKPATPPPPSAGPPKFKVTIAPNVPVGLHDLRLVNKWGVSNPRAFAVGDQAEAVEKEPNDDVAQAQKVEPNTTVNAVINSPTDVDYYVVAGKKGQRLVVACQAGSLDSRAVPDVQVFDGAGRRLAADRGDAYLGDALTDVTPADDGNLLVRVSQFTYTAGGPEFVYRLTVTTAPWIDAAFPSAVEAGKPATVTLYGRNLPGGQPDPTVVVDGRVLEKAVVTVTPPADATRLTFGGRIDSRLAAVDGFEYRVKGPAGVSNPVLFTFARFPVVAEVEGNDTPEKAQAVPGPCEIAGRVDKRGDRDWFAVPVKKGQTFAVELFAERLGSSGDFFLVVRDEKNNELGEFDDNPDTAHPVQLLTRTSDPPVYRYTAAADTTLRLMVSSREAMVQYGPRQQYRLRVGPETPDLHAVVMPPADMKPEGPILRKDGQQMLDVFIFREGGFAGPVTLTAEGLPAGVTCAPVTLAPGIKQGTLVLTVPPNSADALANVVVKAAATVGGKPLVREARPASLVWPVPQPNIPALARLDRSLPVAVREPAPYRLTAALDKPVLKQGEAGKVKVTLARLNPEVKNAVELRAAVPMLIPGQNNNQPVVALNNNQPMQLAAGKNDAELPLAVAATAPPGVYTLVVRGQTQFAFAKDPKAAQKPNVTVIQPSNPLTVTVQPTALAKFTLPNPNATVKITAQVEVPVRVERLYGYDGEYKVKLTLPPTAAGVTCDEVTIPAGQVEGKLIVKAAAAAKPGGLPNLSVQATAMYEGTLAVVHEAKLNVNVVK